jgi:hypothetical protein
MVAPSLVAGGVAAATIALHYRDPHVQGSWGACPFAAIGISCPGCGGLRAVNLLGNGDVAAAASSNLLLVVAIPFVAYLFGSWALRRWRGQPWEMSTRATMWTTFAVIALLVVFTLVRNMPAGAWLAP